MTTIAFKNHVLAADTMITDRGGAFGAAKKIWRQKNDIRIGVAGDAAFIDRIQRGLAHVDALTAEDFALEAVKILREYDEKEAPDVDILVVSSGLNFSVDWYGILLVQDAQNGLAIGSGSKFAKAAMMAGASATEAVEIAAILDHGTGIMGDGPDILLPTDRKKK